MAKMSKRMAIFEKKDKASDKKAGVKEGSKADMKKDAKMPPWLQKKAPAFKKGGMVKGKSC